MLTTESELEAELLDLLADVALVDRATLARDTALGDLGISSLNFVTLLFELEDRYGVAIGEMSSVRTLGEMVDFAVGKIHAEGAKA